MTSCAGSQHHIRPYVGKLERYFIVSEWYVWRWLTNDYLGWSLELRWSKCANQTCLGLSWSVPPSPPSSTPPSSSSTSSSSLEDQHCCWLLAHGGPLRPPLPQYLWYSRFNKQTHVYYTKHQFYYCHIHGGYYQLNLNNQVHHHNYPYNNNH